MNQKHVTVDSDDLNLRKEFEEHVLLNGDKEIINARQWLEQVCAHVPNDNSSPALCSISKMVLLMFTSATTAAVSD